MTKLQKLLEERAGRKVEYTLNDLCELVQPFSRETLAIALGELVRQGGVKKILRVVSPTTQGGIGDFESLDEIPRVIHDWRNDTEVEVNPDNLRVIYVVPAHNDVR